MSAADDQRRDSYFWKVIPPVPVLKIACDDKFIGPLNGLVNLGIHVAESSYKGLRPNVQAAEMAAIDLFKHDFFILLPVGYSLTQRRAAKGFRREDLPRFEKIPSRKIALIPLLLRFALNDKSILMVTEGLGPQPFHGRIVLLVNQHTASASETITGFAKENRLATIVGTKTAGQVLGGTGFKVGHGFVLRLPVVGFRTWNGNTLEGKGVEPDQVTELSREALKEGRDNQLQEAIGVVKQL